MADKNHRSIVPGLVLLGLGIIFLLNNFEILDFSWGTFWAYMILVMGVIFWIGFIADRGKDGFIMPGTIFIVIGLIFIYCSRYGWGAMEYLWPFFILAPALGLYAMYFLGKHDRGILIPAGILAVIGLIFLLQSYRWIRYLWPFVLIITGVLLLLKRSGKTGDQGPES